MMNENLFLNSLFALIKPLLNLFVVSNDTIMCTWPGATANTRVTKDRAINLSGFSVDPNTNYIISYLFFHPHKFPLSTCSVL